MKQDARRDSLANAYANTDPVMDIEVAFCKGWDACERETNKARGNGVLVPGPKLKQMQERITRLNELLDRAMDYLSRSPDEHEQFDFVEAMNEALSERSAESE